MTRWHPAYRAHYSRNAALLAAAEADVAAGSLTVVEPIFVPEDHSKQDQEVARLLAALAELRQVANLRLDAIEAQGEYIARLERTIREMKWREIGDQFPPLAPEDFPSN